MIDSFNFPGAIRRALVVLAALAVAGAWSAGAAARPTFVGTVELPLDDGRLAIRAVVRGLYEACGAEAPASVDAIGGTIDVRTAAGRGHLERIRRATGDLVTIDVKPDRVRITFDDDRVEAAAARAGRSIDEWLAGVADGAAAVSTAGQELTAPRPRRYGITFVTDADPHLSMAAFTAQRREPGAEGMPDRVVVLVHGLDDPGWMWRDVIPALRGAGHVVARMEYPNDGPIAAAADLLAANLAELRYRGVRRIDLVVHSMGGLVTRDVLTRPVYYAGDGRGGGRFPAVGRFVMCGTPNHGSHLRALRGVTEMKEQLSRAFSGDAVWLGSVSDGSGEAGRDLLPGSDFLVDLGRRPLATNVGHTIIAGRMSPVSEGDVDSLSRKLRGVARRSDAPAWLRSWIKKANGHAKTLLEETVRGVGDGVVTIDSARLEGVQDFVVVEANHVSMIVNVLRSSKATPPAIPVILDRLGAE